MFSDYRAVVLEDYRRKRNSGKISLNLTNPTPARIRNECLMAISTRYSKEDEKTLRLFFGPRASVEEYEQAIRKFDIDKFRPLNKFLSNNNIGTDDKNIELLAWLTDFRPRPYRSEMQYSTQEGTIGASLKIAEQAAITHEAISHPAGNSGDQRYRLTAMLSKRRQAAIGLLVAAIVGAFSFVNMRDFLSAEPQCMYWAGERYRAISCNEKIRDSRIIAFDPELVSNFRKISVPDTITRNSIGSVWYSKIDNRLEFFTSGGTHPVHDEKHLRPLTEYIINKYLTGTKKKADQ